MTGLRERIAGAVASVEVYDPDDIVDAVMVEVQRDLDELRAALVECAMWAGEDVSDGPPTSGLCEWAVTAVREHREDSDADARHYVARAKAAEADAARLAKAIDALKEVPIPALLAMKLHKALAAHRGDWIVRGVAGEFYPCTPIVFEATYEPEANDVS